MRDITLKMKTSYLARIGAFALLGGLASCFFSGCSVGEAAGSDDPEGSDQSTSAVAAGVRFQIVGFGATGRCLDVEGGPGQLDNGRNVRMWDCLENDNQRWTYDNGMIKGLGGKCLDIADVNRNNGASIHMWDCLGVENQKWTFDGGRIRGMGGKCLDIAGSPTDHDAGAKVQMYDCIGSANQEFAIRGNTSAPPAGSFIYKNPVVAQDFADPFVLFANGTYHAYATNGNGANVQLITSTDLVHWSGVRESLPKLPGWAQPPSGLTWAPAVLARGGKFVMYYVTRPKSVALQCISRAVADAPAGPFVDDSQAPLICQTDLGGSIDPSPFVAADGSPWLTWKNDGNCCGKPISIWSQKLTNDGRGLVGGPSELIRRDQGWENPLVEGPSMIFANGRYSLLYSANWYDGPDYAVGAAVCDGPAGPCHKPFNGPVLSKQGAVGGPGGQEFFRDAAGRVFAAYHGWTAPKSGYGAGGARSLRIDPVVFEDGVARVQGPTSFTQVIVP